VTKGPRRKRRRYDATRRREAAERTRHEILESAQRLFTSRGYGATAMADVARDAGVALDTVYASVGRKPALMRLLVERAISGVDAPVPAEQREYVRAIQAEPDPGRKLALYAAAIRRIHERLAPLVRAIQAAAAAHPEVAELWSEISARRARNMRLLAAHLAETGALRPALGVDEAADVIWATNAPELYLLLVGDRGWSPERFEGWLADAWRRLLLA
jgi:AcrR family transcriptional regulator